MTDKAVRRLIHRLGDNLDLLLALRKADIIGHHPKFLKSSIGDLNQLVIKINRLRDEGTITAKLPTGTGTKIAEALGLKPGKELGEIIKALQQKVVDGELKPNADFVAAAKEIS